MNPHTFLGLNLFSCSNRIGWVSVYGLPEFFDTKKISDICTIEFFQRSSNLSLLSAITGLARCVCDLLHVGRLDFQGDMNMQAIMYWVNRQLVSYSDDNRFTITDPESIITQTNPQTVMLLRAHDETLPQTLSTFLMNIFELVFRRPLLDICNKTGLFAFQRSEDSGNQDLYNRSIKIEVRPLPHGFNEHQMDSCYAVHALKPLIHDWHRFHDEFFGNMGSDGESLTDHIIDPSSWRPHLAFGLLKLLVTFLYLSDVHRDHPRIWHILRN